MSIPESHGLRFRSNAPHLQIVIGASTQAGPGRHIPSGLTLGFGQRGVALIST